jgi:hypothetical protein
MPLQLSSANHDRPLALGESRDAGPHLHAAKRDLIALSSNLSSAYDDAAASGEAVRRALIDVIYAKCKMQPAIPLTPDEQLCEDVFTLDGQVGNGGFAQWIDNGCYHRAFDTQDALTTIGAPWAADMLDQVLSVLPTRIRAALMTRDVNTLLRYSITPKRERRLEELNDRYFDEESVRGNSGSVMGLAVAYARLHRVGLR